jgi:uncharacterized membrane protein
VLDVGIAAVAWFRTWRSLNLVGFFATFLVATAWGVLRYRPESFAMSEAFLIAFFLLFVLIMLLPARRAGGGRGAPQRRLGQQHAAVRPADDRLRAAVRPGARHRVRRRALGAGDGRVLRAARDDDEEARRARLPFDASLAIATVFLTLVIPFALDERSTAGAWTLEAAGLVWIGFRQGRVLPRAFGYILFVLSGVAMLFATSAIGMPTAFFNAYLFNGLMAAAAAIAGAFFVHAPARRRRCRSGEESASRC